MTPSDIKYRYETSGDRSRRNFFERGTMRFFGDTMRSFGVRKINGETYLYRKPWAHVDVFGNHQVAGREFFNAWRFDPDTGDLNLCDEEEEEIVYLLISTD